MEIKKDLHLTLKFPFSFGLFRNCWYIAFDTEVLYDSDDYHWSFRASLFGFGFELCRVKTHVS